MRFLSHALFVSLGRATSPSQQQSGNGSGRIRLPRPQRVSETDAPE